MSRAIGMLVVLGFLAAVFCGCGGNHGSGAPFVSGGGSGTGGSGSGGNGIVVPVGTTVLQATQQVASVGVVQSGMGSFVTSVNGSSGPLHYYVDGSWQPIGSESFVLSLGTHVIQWHIVDPNQTTSSQILATVLTVNVIVQ